MTKRNRRNNDLQTTTQNTNDGETRISSNTKGELMWPGRIRISRLYQVQQPLGLLIIENHNRENLYILKCIVRHIEKRPK